MSSVLRFLSYNHLTKDMGNKPVWQRVCVYVAYLATLVVSTIALVVIVGGIIYSFFNPPNQSTTSGDCYEYDCSGVDEFPN